MDAGAIWTAAGVVTGAVTVVCVIIVTLVTIDRSAMRKRISELERDRTDYLLRLANVQSRLSDAEHERHEAEQQVISYKSVLRKLRKEKP